MLFNSLQFLIFFPTIVLLYWVIPHRWRNGFLLIASYWFYMNWQPAFALLLFGVTVATWLGAIMIEKYRDDKKRTKYCFYAALGIDLLLLFIFKYLTFVGDEIRRLIDNLGIAIHLPDFTILLPVGISFFTFQAIGYLIDVKRGTIKAENNLPVFALFLSFFPQLVAGPIERAGKLLPQFYQRHKFSPDMLIAGIELMAAGYFMKIAIAENLAKYVDAIYNHLEMHNGTSILIATFFFCFQIFADFAGYSLIAIGAARCMGFRLTQNFRQPYLATSVRDFWRRWHVSLSRWLTDYVYIPLGGNRVSKPRHYLNIFLTLLVSGIWHGADYTFMAWGAYHGSLQCMQAAWHKTSKFHLPDNAISKSLKIFWTFLLVMLGRVFFRSDSIGDAFTVFRKIFTEPGVPYLTGGKIYFAEMLLLVAVLMIIEIRNEYVELNGIAGAGPDMPASIRSRRSLTRSALFVVFLSAIICISGEFTDNAFIYFQF